jgi:DNA-directed RNA polymerase subunit beta
MDEINPLSGITQKRRLTCLGPGGVSRQSGVDIRDIHPSHYGRVCPIETPEGKNAGLVNSLASYGSISLDGYIESPYTYFNNSNRNAVVLLKPESQTQEVFYPYKKTLVQDPRGDIRQRKDVCFISISPTGMISVATSLIPFLEHNDGNRALMASNMQRQAVPILSRERPVVGTGFEGIIARDSRSVIIAPFPTRVIYVDAHTIIIENEMTSLEKLSFLHRKMLKERKTRSFHFIETKKSRTKTIDSNLISTHQVDTNKLHVFVEPFSRSNHNTLLYQYPIIKKHQLLNRGEILADTSTSHKGELSLGKNALVAYMPWEGYNFEDAVLFNERLVVDEIFTSIHIEKYKTNTDIHDGVSEELYIPNKNSFSMYMYDRYGIVRPGIFVKSGDILVGKCRPRVNLETPEQKLLYAIFNEIEKPKRIDCSLKLSHGIRGRIFETFFFPKQKKKQLKKDLFMCIFL